MELELLLLLLLLLLLQPLRRCRRPAGDVVGQDAGGGVVVMPQQPAEKLLQSLVSRWAVQRGLPGALWGPWGPGGPR